VPPGVARTLERSSAVVSQGLAPVPAGSSAHVAQAITQGSHAAFMAGLHLTMAVAACAALVGAALGAFVRGGSTPAGATGPVL
jgi:ABC-type amino acid transport system permease subunit